MSFIHFGCWNQYECNPENPELNGVSQVMNKLINDEKTPNFYVVAGDNYYPKKNKKEKKKFFNKDDFKSGFQCIKRLQKKAPVYMLMGNHDLQYERALYDSETGVLLDKCEIMSYELVYKDTFNFNIHHKILGNTLILFMNSTFYTGDLIEDPNNPEKDCIIRYRYNDYVWAKKIDIIKFYEENVLLYIIEEYRNKNGGLDRFKNIVVCAHDPIVSRRDKIKNGNKLTIKTPLGKSGIRFLNTLYSKFPTQNKFYLCADVHHYQFGIIKIGDNIIHQYVAGTGGTECDEKCPVNPEAEINTFEVGTDDLLKGFKLIECKRVHGYLYCHIDNDSGILKCVFQTSGGCFSGGKKEKNKTQKRLKLTSDSVTPLNFVLPSEGGPESAEEVQRCETDCRLKLIERCGCETKAYRTSCGPLGCFRYKWDYCPEEQCDGRAEQSSVRDRQRRPPKGRRRRV